MKLYSIITLNSGHVFSKTIIVRPYKVNLLFSQAITHAIRRMLAMWCQFSWVVQLAHDGDATSFKEEAEIHSVTKISFLILCILCSQVWQKGH